MLPWRLHQETTMNATLLYRVASVLLVGAAGLDGR